MRDNSTDISSLIKKFCSDNKFKNLIVTQGINGAILYEKNKQKFTTTPAFAVKVIDKVGTGDVMLSVISLFFAATKNHEVGVLAGSMFASKSLLKFGNEDIVSVSELKKFFSTFLN
jgi:sugar/nucleoside kinase (ribokinase family)